MIKLCILFAKFKSLISFKLHIIEITLSQNQNKNILFNMNPTKKSTNISSKTNNRSKNLNKLTKREEFNNKMNIELFKIPIIFAEFLIDSFV